MSILITFQPLFLLRMLHDKNFKKIYARYSHKTICRHHPNLFQEPNIFQPTNNCLIHILTSERLEERWNLHERLAKVKRVRKRKA